MNHFIKIPNPLFEPNKPLLSKYGKSKGAGEEQTTEDTKNVNDNPQND